MESNILIISIRPIKK